MFVITTLNRYFTKRGVSFTYLTSKYASRLHKSRLTRFFPKLPCRLSSINYHTSFY
ncbi:hypothetical protein Hanom_Chr12g01105421 [Helianthus anomalus]